MSMRRPARRHYSRRGLLTTSSHRTLADLCPGTRRDPAAPPAWPCVKGHPGHSRPPPGPAAWPPKPLSLSGPRGLRLGAQCHVSSFQPLLQQHRLWHCPAPPRPALPRPAPPRPGLLPLRFFIVIASPSRSPLIIIATPHGPPLPLIFSAAIASAARACGAASVTAPRELSTGSRR